MDTDYDVIIIGTGAGGGTLAYRLASSGKKILVLERGSFIPREKTNWDAKAVLQQECYRTSELWYDKKGKAMHPGVGYNVGGNTKFYGGSLLRLREGDFEQVTHKGGISPEWPLKYGDFAPYYDQAEKLYETRGQRGLDPTEPPTSQEYPFPAVSHEPLVQRISDDLKTKGLNPFYLPLAVKVNKPKSFLDSCIRCNTCDGFPCFIDGKSDSDVNCVRPALAHSNLTLLTEAKVIRLHTSASGREVTAVEAEIAGIRQMFSGDIVVVACGAINSAVLLLQSANDQHPNGLANSSDQVGRNYMTHNNAVVMEIRSRKNNTDFQKTMACHDFYWGEEGFPYPMGAVQMLGNLNKERMVANGPPLIPLAVLDAVAQRTVAWWLMSEDLPSAENRVRLKNGKITLEYTNNNMEAYKRLVKRWIAVLKSIEQRRENILPSTYIPTKVPLREVGHQCGTCRFGEDPKRSVLDVNCRAHDLDNLYVVDGAFFPSSSAVNPSLTIMANALRVGDHLLERLQASSVVTQDYLNNSNLPLTSG